MKREGALATRWIHGVATRVGLVTAGALLFFPSVVLAQRIFVNDVDVTDANMSGTVLENVQSVRFGDGGELRIIAPGTNIRVAGGQGQAHASASNPGRTTSDARSSAPSSSGTPSTAAAGRPATGSPAASSNAGAAPAAGASATVPRAAGSYIMTIANPYPGTVPYEVDILINGNHVATWGPHRANSALDVGEWMKAGRNVVTFNARRVSGTPRSSQEREIRIIVGEGSFDGQRASVTRILAGQIFRSSDREPTRTQSVDFELPAR